MGAEETNSNNTAEPASKGLWEPINYRFKHLPVHLALLHSGKVLAFGGSGNDENHLDDPYPAEIFEPNDIGSDNGRVYEISNQNIEGDIFCAGHAFLPDGRLLVAGGTYKYDGKLFGFPIPPFSGLKQSYIIDPIHLKWTRVHDMQNGRWYPTCITLSDGRILVMSGLTEHFPWAFPRKLEIYADSEGISNNNNGWQNLPKADHWIPLYPRLHLLPSGEVFYAGSYNTHYTFPFSLAGFPSANFNLKNNRWTVIGNPKNLKREEGTTVLLPLTPPDYTARVLLIAGGTQPGNDAINNVEMIDFSDKPPRYKSIQPLKHPRYYCYAVLLPDKNVLVLGGKIGTKGMGNMNPKMILKDEKKSSSTDHAMNQEEVPQNPLAVREPELFNTEDRQWYPMTPMQVDRLYHANALLLPDGRVLTAGSNPDRRINELRIELYSPPYLFKGERPKILKYPSEISYGQSFEIETGADANNIKEVVLLHPSVTTHCVNTEQRYVGLEFDQTNSNTLSVKVPSNKNILPPGYYMLFVIKHEGVPSIARFVLILGG
jgi:hypothetical protein